MSPQDVRVCRGTDSFSTLTDTPEETDRDATNKWDTIKKTNVEVATKVLGHMKKNNKEWLTPEI